MHVKLGSVDEQARGGHVVQGGLVGIDAAPARDRDQGARQFDHGVVILLGGAAVERPIGPIR